MSYTIRADSGRVADFPVYCAPQEGGEVMEDINNVLEAEVLSSGLSERETRSAAYAALRAARVEGVGVYDVYIHFRGTVTPVTVKVTAGSPAAVVLE